MISTEDKKRLIKVCKVLFPKYKHVSINRNGSIVTFKQTRFPILKWFWPGLKMSLTELIEFRIPKQLADFKHGNSTFINFIQEDLVRCNLNGKNKIEYFLEEITKVKYSDVYKQLNLDPGYIVPPPIRTEEDEMFDAMIQLYKGEEKTISVKPKSYWVSMESLFYLSLLLIIIYSILIRI